MDLRRQCEPFRGWASSQDHWWRTFCERLAKHSASGRFQTIAVSALHKIELAGLGLLYNAPIDVQLSEFDIVQPDLVIILNENARKITPIKIKVAPNLMVEILSPSTAGNDRTIKKDLYERSGVNEYWIVDPFEQQVDQWILRDGKYILAPQSNVIRLSFVSDVEVDFETVW